MIATLTTSPIKQSISYLSEDNENHDSTRLVSPVNLDINENGQITLPKYLLEQWGIGAGSQITLIPQIEENTQQSKVKKFDETQTLSVAELIQYTGVTTNKKATIEQMDDGIKKLFKNWEC